MRQNYRVVAAMVFAAIFVDAAQAQQRPDKIGKFVYGGQEVSREEAPWQVVVYLANETRTSGLLCGGTLIAPRWILTAAHCFFNPYTGVQYPDYSIGVAAGSTLLRGTMSRLDIDGPPVFPSGYGFGTWDNDIALLKLRSPVRAQFIALASPADEQSQATPVYRVTGWGKTETANVSNVLLYADVPLVPKDACAAVSDYRARLTDRLMCAGSVGKDTCKGDSGGPLYQRLGQGAAIQFGVTVAGEGCGIHPGVYSRVSLHRDWIEKTLATTNEKPVGSSDLRARLSACTPQRELNGEC